MRFLDDVSADLYFGWNPFAVRESIHLEVANVKLLSKGTNISFMCSIRDITAEVGAAVLRAAVAEDLAEGHGDVGARELQHMSKVQKCY